MLSSVTEKGEKLRPPFFKIYQANDQKIGLTRITLL